jgi:acetylornithine/succinyldiaminopimelate/putrescine aminotransferase
VTEVRGRGLMLAAEVDFDAPVFVKRALEEQALVLNATGPRTVRFIPPLVVTEDEISEALRRLAELVRG